MNSAEKKAPEPSMDDIISSIRNIIADDSQVTPPAQDTPAVETQPAPVVQLTENQITAPVNETTGISTGEEISASVAAPVSPPVAEATTPPTSAELEIASEIEGVPGIVAGAETPGASGAKTDAGSTQTSSFVAPALNISEPLAPATAGQNPKLDDVAGSISTTPEVSTAAPAMPVVNEMAAPDAIAEVSDSIVPEAMTPTAPIPTPVQAAQEAQEAQAAMVAPLDELNDVVFASEPIQAPSPNDENEFKGEFGSTGPATDPVEKMIQAVEADQSDSDTNNNGVDPDQILEGMEAPTDQHVKSAVVEAATPVAQEQAIEVAPVVKTIVEETPVVLDASHVTPEDAAAINAVATATSEAMAGASASGASQEKKPGGRTLEESVKAMLKPMIREWLDDNMPRILEGAIKEEVDETDSN